MIICEPSQKPLVFFHLVLTHQVINALVFTKSAESTTRLVKLFEFFERARLADAPTGEKQKDSTGEDMDMDTQGPTKPIVVRSYSSDLSAGERKSILDQFKAQEIQMYVPCHRLFSKVYRPLTQFRNASLVCSDLISRGIDISHVSHVVSYDVPVDMRKYVHRVGRTARAGRHGDAWTLVEEQEVRLRFFALFFFSLLVDYVIVRYPTPNFLWGYSSPAYSHNVALTMEDQGSRRTSYFVYASFRLSNAVYNFDDFQQVS